MSAMVARWKVADSRSPSSAMFWGRSRAGRTVSWGSEVMVMGLSLVRRRVVDAEVVEAPCRSVAFEVRGVVGAACRGEEPAESGGRRRLGGVAVDVHFSGHDVLCESDAGVAGDGHLALLVHSGCVVS